MELLGVVTGPADMNTCARRTELMGRYYVMCFTRFAECLNCIGYWNLLICCINVKQMNLSTSNRF